MVNNYVLSFQKSADDLSLSFLNYTHRISYKNQLEKMDFSGKIIYDNGRYETYIISNEFDFNLDVD